MTFGSVVTSINQSNSYVFYEVGKEVDEGSCDLVLNCGQLQTEDTYKPDLENNVWFKPSWGGNVTWKSITLTHTGVRLLPVSHRQSALSAAKATAILMQMPTATATGFPMATTPIFRTCANDSTHTENGDCSAAPQPCTTLAVCDICKTTYGEPGGHTAEPTYAPNAEDSTKHDVTYSCCGATVTEAHTLDVTTGKCVCGADMTVVATVTDGTNTYYAADAATLNQAVTAILETGSRTFTVELPADAEAEMITTIRRAICDTEGVADGSIHLTLKGVTSIPGTTNWDGVAFGPRNAQWDENNVEIVSHEEVTQLASVNLPDVTEIGAQAFLNCSNLTSITAPKVQFIGDWGLQGTAITSIDMPLLKEARYSAFCSTALTEVSLPSLETAGVIVFGHCKQLRTVDLPKLQNLSQQLFTRCTSLVSVSAPAATSMGNNVFKGCSELVSITLPGVTELTNEAFAECTKLENITLGSVITKVNVNLFAGEALSSGITLTLNCGQKNAETLPAAAGTNVEWAGFTWKEVKFAHSYVNSKCTVCGEDCAHTGGTATCTTLAVCDTCGVSYGAVDTTNHDSSVECVNGFCPNGCYEPATLNAEGYYEIDNAGQLFWFAQQVNVNGNREIKGVLTVDIDLENKPWTPIGSTGEENNNFRGVFDGQGHTIKGLYVEGSENGVGFFGEVRTGTVKNFTIYGEVIVNTEVDYVGGVIGSICGVNGETDLERNGAVIQNITSFVNVTAKAHGIGMIGGFVGYANHQSLIEQCAWYGTFDAGEYRVDSGAGGFIGKIQENTSEVTIRNCGAYGTIKTNYAGDYNNTATIYMGGFLSFSNTNAQTTLENCLFAGRFECGENLTDQAFLGAFGTLRSVNAIKNCYYLCDDGLAAVHSDSNLKPGSDNVEITKVTGEALRNNTIATQLGDLWEQDVHYPALKEGQTWHGDSATYTYTDNGDGTHKKTCNECGYVETSRPHTFIDNACICSAISLHIDSVTVAGWVEAEETINAGWAMEVTEEALELLSSYSPGIIPEGELHGSADQHQCIGISVTNENNHPLYQADNDAWYHDGNGWFSDATAPICDSNTVFSAYYPYFSLDSYLIPWHIDECELLYGTATDSTESLTLERRQARLVLTPTFGSEILNYDIINEICISGVYTEGTFNGITGTLTPGGEPNGTISMKKNDDGIWETGLIPMDAKTVTLTIRTNENKYYITTVELPAVEAGKQYNMTVQVGTDILDLEGVDDPYRWSIEENLLGYTEIPAALQDRMGKRRHRYPDSEGCKRRAELQAHHNLSGRHVEF